MQSEVAKISNKFSVGQAIELFRNDENLPKVFYDVFVVDNENRLEGSIPLCTIISSSRSKRIVDIMRPGKESVHHSVDQEDVADIFRKRNLTSLAVVYCNEKLIGSIYIDDIIDVIDDEADEDFFKLGGIGKQTFYDAIISITKARFLWLTFNLFSALAASLVIKNYAVTIEKIAILEALMPIVASMGGCSRTQSLTSAVRAIAMKQLNWNNVVRSVGKEVIVSFLNGCIFSIITGLIIYLFLTDVHLSLLISFSMF